MKVSVSQKLLNFNCRNIKRFLILKSKINNKTKIAKLANSSIGVSIPSGS